MQYRFFLAVIQFTNIISHDAKLDQIRVSLTAERATKWHKLFRFTSSMFPEALPYHLRVRDHFRQQTSVWEFFSAAPTREEQLGAAERQARMQLYTLGNGELEVAGRIVTAIVDLEDSEPSYLETARLFNFYTRIYGDRCAGEVTGDPADAEYPLRVRVLQLWREKEEQAGPEISLMVEGPRELGRLDIFSQARLRKLTRELILEFLRPGWIRTLPVTTLAYAYFADLTWDETADEHVADKMREQLAEGLAGAHGSVLDYFAFVILDLVMADASLEEPSANRARTFAADLQLADSFGHLYNRKSN
jgi:hypothetical protein